MPSDLRKAIDANDYNEGGATAIQPLKVDSIASVSRQNTPSSIWDAQRSNLSNKFKQPNYYTQGELLTPSSGDVASGTNSDAVVTYSADEFASHKIEGIYWSYNGTPTGGALTVEDGAGVFIHSQNITSGGAGFAQFGDKGFKGSKNTDLIITLSAAGAGIVGTISVEGHEVI